MTTVRKLSLEIESDTYPAIERTLIDSVGNGEAPPTIMAWTFASDLFLELGPVEDASLIDREQASNHGIAYGRRYNVSGGTGFFRDNCTPVLYAFFTDGGDRSMTEFIDLAGEAVASALREAGVDNATYRDGGDIELIPENGDQLLKIGVSGAGYQDGVWGVFANVINRSFEPKEFGIIDDVLRLPKEKFEDKDTDSAAGRMTSLEEEAPDVNLEAVLSSAAENLAGLVGDGIEDGSLTVAEREALEGHREFYGSTEWFERYSTGRIIEEANDDHEVAEVAYKARKLIKVSVRVDDAGTIDAVQYTGDMYHRPGFDAIDRLNKAVTGVAIDDDDALLKVIEDVYADPEIEIPWLTPMDFVRPLVRARESLVPASAFERDD
ncbi:biotin/lipoate A/B protein ligase family protein [Natrialbaceae archaeon A-CW1-1]